MIYIWSSRLVKSTIRPGLKKKKKCMCACMWAMHMLRPEVFNNPTLVTALNVSRLHIRLDTTIENLYVKLRHKY